jgi:pantetheine-phosphate adenylyltransferase
MDKPMRLVYAGSFDPITLGHLTIVRRAHMLCDQVVILIANNPDKKGLFSVRERMEMALETLDFANLDHVYVMKTSLYVVEWCRAGDVLVRGIRDGADLVAEQAIAAFNRCPKVEKEKGRIMYPNPVETIWLPAENSISSTRVKEMAKADDPELQYAVAPSVAKRLKEKLS